MFYVYMLWIFYVRFAWPYHGYVTSRTLLSIMTELNTAIIRMVLLVLLFPSHPVPFTNPSGIVLTAPIIVDITITFISHSFSSSHANIKHLSLFRFNLFLLYVLSEQQRPRLGRFIFYLFIFWLSLSLIVCPRLGDPFVSQSPKEVCGSHCQVRILGCTYTTCSCGQMYIYHLFEWSKVHILRVCMIKNYYYYYYLLIRVFHISVS